MADGSTVNYSWILPETGASADSWGTKLNDNLSSIDTDLHAVSVAQGNYLPLTGGTLSGNLSIQGTLGINYSGSAHWLSLGWDGSFVTASVDAGGVVVELAHVSWVEAYAKPAGAYTPNQNVDYGASPAFGNLTATGNVSVGGAVAVGGTFGVNGLLSAYGSLNAAGNITAGAAVIVGGTPGVIYSAFSNNQFAFNWDGVSIRHIVNGGDQGALIRSVSGSGIYRIYEIDISVGNATVEAWYGTGGNTYVTWPISWASDRRLKDNVRACSGDALKIINGLPVYEADVRMPIEDGPVTHHCFTLMADEVAGCLPEAVIQPQHDGAYETLREGPIICLLLRAVQQLSARVAMLEDG